MGLLAGVVAVGGVPAAVEDRLLRAVGAPLLLLRVGDRLLLLHLEFEDAITVVVMIMIMMIHILMIIMRMRRVMMKVMVMMMMAAFPPRLPF